MLPFLKKKDVAHPGLIVKTRTPDEKPESEENDSSAGIEACASELIRAVHAKDSSAVAAALRDAFDIMESGEDESEKSSVEPHSYEAQNIKAGEQE